MKRKKNVKIDSSIWYWDGQIICKFVLIFLVSWLRVIAVSCEIVMWVCILFEPALVSEHTSAHIRTCTHLHCVSWTRADRPRQQERMRLPAAALVDNRRQSSLSKNELERQQRASTLTRGLVCPCLLTLRTSGDSSQPTREGGCL